MTDSGRSNDSPTRDEDRRFADLIAESFRPEAMDFEARANFDRALRARIEQRPRRRLVLVPVVVAAAALAFWIASSIESTPPYGDVPGPAPQVAVEPAPRASEADTADAVEDWSEEIFDSVDSIDARYADDLDSLPDEYLAIGSVLMGFDV